MDQALNYAAIRVDGNYMYLSTYEHSGVNRRVNSPSIGIDLKKLPEQKEYWVGEYNSIFKTSNKIDNYEKKTN